MGTPGGLTHLPSPSSHGPSPAVTPPLPLSPLGSPPLSSPLCGHLHCHPFSLAGDQPPLLSHPSLRGHSRCLLWVASCCHPPSHCHPFSLAGHHPPLPRYPSFGGLLPAITPPLSPFFPGGRAPLWPRRVLSALESRGPSFPTALCSGGHAPSPERVAIGRPGHVNPAPPPWELASQLRGGTARVRCSACTP